MSITIHESGVQIGAGGGAPAAARYRSASEFSSPGAEAMGRGLQQLGQSLGQVAGKMHQKAVEENQADFANALTDQNTQSAARVNQWHINFEEQHKETDAQGYVEAYNSFMQKERASWEALAGGDKKRLASTLSMFNSVYGSGLIRAQNYAAKEKENYAARVDAEDWANRRATFINLDIPLTEKEAAWRTSEMGMRARAGQTLVTGEDGKQEWTGGKNIEPTLIARKEEFRLDVQESLRQDDARMVLKNPRQAAEVLEKWRKDGGVPENMRPYFKPAEWAAHMAHMEGLSKGKITADKENFGLRTRDLQATFRDGKDVPDSIIPGREEFVAVYGEERGGRLYADLMRERQYGRDLAALTQMTPAQMLEARSRLELEPGAPGYAEAMERRGLWERAVGEDLRRREADPALYVMADSGVQRAAAALSGQKPGTKEYAAALDNYTATLRAAYETRGMNPGGPLLSKAQVMEISNMFLTGQPANAVALINQVQESWGKYHTEVFKQLVTDKDAALPGAVYVIWGGDMKPEPAVLLSAGLQEPKFMEESRLALGKGYDEIIRLAPEVASPMVKTFDAQGGGREAAMFIDAVTVLAVQYARSGIKPEKAVKKAYAEVGASRYTIQDGYRVPVQHDAKRIKVAADYYLDTVMERAGEFTQDIFAETWRTEEEKDRLTAEAIRQNAEWVTNQDETGLILYRGRCAVLQKNGRFVELTWEELDSLYYYRPQEPAEDYMP